MVYDQGTCANTQPSISSASVLQLKGMQQEWPQPTWGLQDDMIDPRDYMVDAVGTSFILPSVALLC